MSEDITGLSVELNTEPTEAVPTPEVVTPEVTEEETIGALEVLSQKTDDAVPLKKYMAEKNAKKELETRAKLLEQEIAELRSNPTKSSSEIKLDVKTLSDKHNIDEEVLSDILNASYKMTKDKVREELEQELNPKLAEFEAIKREKVQHDFETKFNGLLTKSLEEMPEYVNLVDKEDLKQWVRSGQYSKLSLPQLIEQKYGKFVVGKKTIESGNSSKEVEMPDTSKPLTDEQYLKLDTDPELRKNWANSLTERAKRMM